jgi:HME family heavy-metal exporter
MWRKPAKTRDAAVNGQPAVMLTFQATRRYAQADGDVIRAEDLKISLPADIRISRGLSTETFIELSIKNVTEALRDGGILVVIILFLFLMNFRTTFITLTAIPLSLMMTVIVFHFTGMSINTMTLGGLAVAIGELVDDAIVDVENIFRRLRENRTLPHPKSPLLVVFQASAEIRNSIVFSTMIICLVFVPLFALSGMEGRLFTPLGIAYIVSIVASRSFR